MKKFLKITAAVIAVIMLLLVSLPLLFTDKIEALIKEEGNKMLNAEFDFGSLDISLIRNFPLASVTLEDFYLKGAGVFENDTLVAAGELTASVNLMSLFGDEGYDIREILIDDASVKAIVLADGTVKEYRYCIHPDIACIDRVEITVHSTYGHDGARIFEVRLY